MLNVVWELDVQKFLEKLEDAALVNHIVQVPSLTAVAARKETNFLHDY
jgi:hypothetical protein